MRARLTSGEHVAVVAPEAKSALAMRAYPSNSVTAHNGRLTMKVAPSAAAPPSLHELARDNGITLAAVRDALAADPTSAATKMAGGYYPLQYMCWHNSGLTPALLQEVHNAYPQAAQELDTAVTRGNALHFICLWKGAVAKPDMHVELVRMVADFSPDAATAKHTWQYTPLSMIVWGGAEAPGRNEAMQLVHSLWPGAAHERDNEKRTPIYVACKKENSLAKIEAVHALDPTTSEAARLTRLHRMCYSRDATAAELLAEALASPASVSTQDEEGNTPFDCLSNKKREDPATNAAICAALPALCFKRFAGQGKPTLQYACCTPDGALQALQALVDCHTRDAKTTWVSVDLQVLPQLLGPSSGRPGWSRAGSAGALQARESGRSTHRRRRRGHERPRRARAQPRWQRGGASKKLEGSSLRLEAKLVVGYFGSFVIVGSPLHTREVGAENDKGRRASPSVEHGLRAKVLIRAQKTWRRETTRRTDDFHFGDPRCLYEKSLHSFE